MTVAELIKVLSDLPPDAIIRATNDAAEDFDLRGIEDTLVRDGENLYAWIELIEV